jgi:general secretion pathway protein I
MHTTDQVRRLKADGVRSARPSGALKGKVAAHESNVVPSSYPIQAFPSKAHERRVAPSSPDHLRAAALRRELVFPLPLGEGPRVRADRSRSVAFKSAFTQHAFTLIEVLVALAIIAIALLAALRAAGQATANAGELRAHLLASWVAENRLAEARAFGTWPQLGIHRGAARQGGLEFAWREDVTPTPNAWFRRVDVQVYRVKDESHALARLTGFLVHPAAER